ncbi:MAG: hypothetical protein ACREOW_08790 [Thermodesulfobacteriota bacterium]
MSKRGMEFFNNHAGHQKEADKVGFKKCVLPPINLDTLKYSGSSLSLIGANSIEKAIEVLF